jgi:hypothetical protein
MYFPLKSLAFATPFIGSYLGCESTPNVSAPGTRELNNSVLPLMASPGALAWN